MEGHVMSLLDEKSYTLVNKKTCRCVKFTSCKGV